MSRKKNASGVNVAVEKVPFYMKETRLYLNDNEDDPEGR